MPRYHVSEDGVTRLCTVQEESSRPCPVMGRSEVQGHFNNKKDAQKAYEQVMSENQNIVIKSLRSLEFGKIDKDLALSRLEDVYAHMTTPENKPTLKEVEALREKSEAFIRVRKDSYDVKIYEFNDKALELEGKIIQDEISKLKRKIRKNTNRINWLQEKLKRNMNEQKRNSIAWRGALDYNAALALDSIRASREMINNDEEFIKNIQLNKRGVLTYTELKTVQNGLKRNATLYKNYENSDSAKRSDGKQYMNKISKNFLQYKAIILKYEIEQKSHRLPRPDAKQSILEDQRTLASVNIELAKLKD